MRWRLPAGLGLAAAAGTAVALLAPQHAGTADPLDGPALSASPAQLLAAADQVVEHHTDVVYLRRDAAITYDADGGFTMQIRDVVAIRSPAAARAFAALDLRWIPGIGTRPIVRGRVIGPDGQVTPFDPSKATEAPAKDADPNADALAHVLHTPLPPLSTGSVIEMIHTERDRALPAPVVPLVHVPARNPIERLVVTISAPRGLPVHVVARGFAVPPTPARATNALGTTWRYDLGHLGTRDEPTSDVPLGRTDRYIGATTGRSWSAVAAADAPRFAFTPGRAVALPAGVRGATQRQTANRALAWLHHHVGYGVVDPLPYTPAAPAETLARGVGDCKDMSTLLIAVLHDAGIDAVPALTRSEAGVEIDPALPGQQFEHAIVRARLDGEDVWIDPTSELAAGDLPPRLHGRPALVLAPGTRGLTTLPVTASAEQTIREVRTYHLPLHGPGSVTEILHATGSVQGAWRHAYHDLSAAAWKADLARQVHRAYDGTIARVSVTGDDDPTEPFEVSIEVRAARDADTGYDAIVVRLPPAESLLDHPPVLAVDRAEIASRTTDYVWAMHGVLEEVNRLILPPGFASPDLPAHEERQLGTMTLTTTRRRDGDTYVVTYRLDTGKRRISADELRATYDAIQPLQHADAIELRFPRATVALADRGDVAAAIAADRREIAAHPGKALYLDRMASLYRRFGMGAESLRLARRAVAVEPTSADAWCQLADWLHVDTLGHDFGFDADLAGSVAAYRRALALDPDHLPALRGLAHVLAHDPDGRPTTDPDRLAQAIALLRNARAVAGDDDATVVDALVDALIAAGDGKEADALAREAPFSADAASRKLAAAAELDPSNAVDVARRLAPDPAKRSHILRTARDWLLSARRYPAARTLDAELCAIDPDAAGFDCVSRPGQIDLDRMDPADPRRPVLLADLANNGIPVANPPWNRGVADLLTDWGNEPDDHDRWLQTLSSAAARDLEAACVELQVDGDAATGWTVTARYLGDEPGISYVALDRGQARLVGNQRMPAEIGAYVLALADRGDRAGAGRWLERYGRDDARLATGTSQTGWWPRWRAAFADATSRAGTGPLTIADLDVLAAALAADTHAAVALRHLPACAHVPAKMRLVCLDARMDALANLGRGPALAAAARDLLATKPAWGLSNVAVEDLARAVAADGHLDEAARILDDALATRPDHFWLLLSRAQVAYRAGDRATAARMIDRAAALPDPSAERLNELAWLRAAYDADPAAAHTLADRALGLDEHDSNLLNTAAAIDAERGDLAAAWKHVQATLATRLDHAPSDADWYVLGLIAERCGLRADAIADYRRIHALAGWTLDPTSYELARRRLAALGVR